MLAHLYMHKHNIYILIHSHPNVHTEAYFMSAILPLSFFRLIKKFYLCSVVVMM